MNEIQVPGVGPKDCEICFVGEAPGAEEARRRVPFVGSSGRLFDKLLSSTGIIRRSCYITNVIKERPADNDISRFVNLSSRGYPRTKEYTWYEQYLYEELRDVTARVLVPLGRTALYALCRRTDITNRRGSILECTVKGLEGRKVIPTIHPAAALRQHSYTYLITGDLRRIKEQSKFPDIRRTPRTYHIHPSFDEAFNYLKNILNNQIETSVDIETDRQSKQMTCICFTTSPYDSMSIPFYSSYQDYFPPDQESDIMLMVAKVLEDPKVPKIFQNAAFDTKVLFELYGIITENFEDTMVAQGILYPDLPKSLAYMTSAYTEEPYYKDEGAGTIKGQFGDEYLSLSTEKRDEMFWTYNAKDGAVTHEIWPKLRQMLMKQGNWLTYQTQKNLVPILTYMEHRGMRVDTGKAKDLSVTHQKRADHLTETLQKLVDYDINPNSPLQIKKLFYEEKKEKPYLKDGKPTVDDMALKRLSRKGHREAGLIREIRKLRKMNSTYLTANFGSDGRIRSGYNPVGTKTGRLSSSKTWKGEGSNRQNQPPTMKSCYLADPGCILVDIDLSQAENRIVAYCAPEPNMIHAFERGLDLHAHTYSLIFNIPIDEVSDEPGSSEFGDGTKSQRFWGKQMNHSLDYGLGYKTFSLRYELPEHEGRRLVDGWHQVYPCVRSRFQYNIQQELRKTMTVVNCYGRKRRFMARFDDNLHQDAYAQFPQSTVADKINRDGLLYIWDNQSIYKRVEIMNQVHDSLVLQIPLSAGWAYIEDVIYNLKCSLESPVPWKDPFVIPVGVEIGTNLGEMIKVADLSTLGKNFGGMISV